jgi:hypothetical protein
MLHRVEEPMRRVISVLLSLSALVVVALAVPGGAAADGTTLYVAYGDALNDGPGSSCSDPGYRSEDQQAIVDALGDAEAGDTVRICEGEYVYTDDGYGDVIADGVSIVGAGVGKTILDGDDAYYLMYLQDGVDITIRGITFTNARDDYGAALTLRDIEATVVGCAFLNNTATHAGEDYGGAGIYLYDASDVAVISSRFEGNVAADDSAGGAINIWTDDGVTASLLVKQSTFVGNEAGQGPAIYFDDSDGLDVSETEVVLINNRFVGNVNTNLDDDAADGGAVAFEHTDGNLTMSGNSFIDNEGANFGGAVEIWDVTGKIVVERNTFTGNVAGEGGALWIDVRNGVQHVRRNTFRRNQSSGAGGAIAYECESVSSVRIMRSLESANSYSGNRASQRRDANVFASDYGCVL